MNASKKCKKQLCKSTRHDDPLSCKWEVSCIDNGIQWKIQPTERWRAQLQQICVDVFINAYADFLSLISHGV